MLTLPFSEQPLDERRVPADTPRVNRAWLSVHFGFAGRIYDSAGDRAIHRFVTPVVEHCHAAQLISSAFFIRYSDRGPHIRLRLLPVEPGARQEVISTVEAHGQCLQHTSEGTETEESSISWVDYEPEVKRYGGARCIAAAEDLFAASSTYAVRRLSEAVSGDRSRRLGEGLLSMVLTLHTFLHDRHRARIWMQHYGDNYLRTVASRQEVREKLAAAFTVSQQRQADTMRDIVNAMWEQRDASGALDSDVELYADALSACRDALEQRLREGELVANGVAVKDMWIAATAIGSSYLHMMNNRLGISIVEEAFLAFILQRALA